MIPKTIYSPNQRHADSLIYSIKEMSNNVLLSRYLIWQLFKRDFFADYKKSFLGSSWILISPFAGIVSWLILQASGVLVPSEVGVPYAAYILVGTTVWGLFVSLYVSASNTLNAGVDLVMQVNYPHEALFFQQLLNQLANFSIILFINIIGIFLIKIISPETFKIDFPKLSSLWFPVVILPLFFLASSIGLFISMINVVASDIGRFISLNINFGMYVTPIIYSHETVSNTYLDFIITWNPLTYLVCSARDILLYGHIYNHDYFAFTISSLISFFLFIISCRLFYVSEKKVIERMI